MTLAWPGENQEMPCSTRCTATACSHAIVCTANPPLVPSCPQLCLQYSKTIAFWQATVFLTSVLAAVLHCRSLQEVLTETGQEVPGWLGNIATRHAPYGTKNRRGGGRFGGRDFRKDHGNCKYLWCCADNMLQPVCVRRVLSTAECTVCETLCYDEGAVIGGTPGCCRID